jgi:hypothetical protein
MEARVPLRSVPTFGRSICALLGSGSDRTRAWRIASASLAACVALGGSASAQLQWKEGDKSFTVGWWGQAWAQHVEVDDGEDLDDFMVRRQYLYLSGTVNPWLSAFANLASDRLGQDGITEDSGKGFGSGIGLRDGWITCKLAGDAAQLQLGRMYVPFTRNYGTTSPRAQLTLDLDWFQGGLRGGIFYPSNVGRDDSATLWGNLWEGLVQYRAMYGDGVSSVTDDARLAGRVSLSLWDKETTWFNEGTYLEKKKVLSFGVGVDSQDGAAADGNAPGTFDDYSAWTADAYMSLPFEGGGAISTELSYIDVENSPNAVASTPLEAGSDAQIASAKLGYLIRGKMGPGQWMPYVHYQLGDVDADVASPNDSTAIYGIGAQCYIAGHMNKLGFEITRVDQDEEIDGTSEVDETLFTLQLAAGW